MNRLLLFTSVVALIAGCTPQPSPTPSRPSSPVVVTFTSPADGSTIHGGTVHVAITLQGGTITDQVSNNISPTVGHIHLYLNGKLIYMVYALEEDITEPPGLYNLYAEYVAADHYPYNPRDVTPHIAFQLVSP